MIYLKLQSNLAGANELKSMTCDVLGLHAKLQKSGFQFVTNKMVFIQHLEQPIAARNTVSLTNSESQARQDHPFIILQKASTEK